MSTQKTLVERDHVHGQQINSIDWWVCGAPGPGAQGDLRPPHAPRARSVRLVAWGPLCSVGSLGAFVDCVPRDEALLQPLPPTPNYPGMTNEMFFFKSVGFISHTHLENGPWKTCGKGRYCQILKLGIWWDGFVCHIPELTRGASCQQCKDSCWPRVWHVICCCGKPRCAAVFN